MDFTLWIALLIISLIFVLIGFFKKQVAVLAFGGIGLFLLGIFTFTNIYYESGYNETTQYGYVCACCENGTFTYGLTYSGFCSGVEPTCDTYDGNQALCESVGCTWDNVSLCLGNPTPCEEYLTSSECGRYGFCEWSETGSNGCLNGSTQVLINETKTNTPIVKVWSGGFKPYLGYFIVLCGLALIFVAGFEVFGSKPKDYEEEE